MAQVDIALSVREALSMADLVTRLRLLELLNSALHAILYLLPFLLVVYVCERRAGADRARYWTRHFLNDSLYTLFYWGGFYNVFIFAALANLLEPRLDFLKLNLLSGLSWPLQLACWWVLGDFLTYWLHRLQHRWSFLWAFHSVHHSQQRLNTFTAYRRHPVEKLIIDFVVFFVIIQLVLGIATRQWLPLTVLMTGFQVLQHAELNWRYGPFERLIVSPAFHSVHHSTEKRYYTKNFGQMLSLWDFVFGTAVEADRPARTGVEGLDMKESLPDQLVAPVRYLWRGYAVRRGPLDTPVPPA
jgi:sterol desaturase/sphingolipid hydroxylase (fatty acid hydroxylase superfamily)